MSTFTKLTYHVVFGTKYRRPLITPGFQERLYKYIGGIIREKSGHLIEIGGIADHIHILAHFPPTISVSAMIGELKGSSSTWTNTDEHGETRCPSFRMAKGIWCIHSQLFAD
jgi:putative transposase